MAAMETVGDRAAVLQTCALLDQEMDVLRNRLKELESTRMGLARLLDTREFAEDDEEARNKVLVTMVRRMGSIGPALERLAEEGQGRLHLGKSVGLIHEAGISSPNRGTVRSMAARHVRKKPGWVEEDDDWFAFVPKLPPGQVARPKGSSSAHDGDAAVRTDDPEVVESVIEDGNENEIEGGGIDADLSPIGS